MRTRLAEPHDGPTVVVAHHAPSARCVPDHLREDRWTVAYASRLDDLIEETQPDAWVYGHVHEAVRPFRIGRTLLVSNPRGYPDAPNPLYRPDLVVEV